MDNLIVVWLALCWLTLTAGFAWLLEALEHRFQARESARRTAIQASAMIKHINYNIPQRRGKKQDDYAGTEIGPPPLSREQEEAQNLLDDYDEAMESLKEIQREYEEVTGTLKEWRHLSFDLQEAIRRYYNAQLSHWEEEIFILKYALMDRGYWA